MTVSDTQNKDTHPTKQPPTSKFASWSAKGFKTELVAVAAGEKRPVEPNWQYKLPSDADIRAWDTLNHNLGIRTRDHPFMDVDCDDPDTALDICRALGKLAKTAPMRTRTGSDRFGLLFTLARNEPRFKKFKRVWTRQTSNGTTPLTEKFEIEILADGQQFVAEGKHPDGGEYAWTGSPPTECLLMPVCRADFEPWLDEISRVVLGKGWHAQKQRHAGTTNAPGTSAMGTKCPEGLTHLVSGMFAQIPNDLSVDYDQWIKLGIAAKAAGDFFEEWDAWSAKSSINEDAKDNRDTWDSFDVSGAAGIGTIIKEAELAGWVKPVELLNHYRNLKEKEQEQVQSDPAADFEAVPGSGADTDNPFFKEFSQKNKLNKFELRPGWLPVVGINLPDPWLYGDKLMRGTITVLAGRGGVSKSTLALGWCIDMCLDQKTPLLGEKTHERGLKCAYINADDSDAKLMKRVKAACLKRGVTIDDLKDRLWFMTANDLPAEFSLSDKGSRQLLMTALTKAGVSALVLDPMANLSTVEENSNTEMVKMLHALGQMAEAAKMSVCLVHHERKGAVDNEDGSQNVDAIRGAGGIIGRARIAFQLRPMNAADAKSLGSAGPVSIKGMVRLDNSKQNYAPMGKDAEWYSIESIELGNPIDGFFSEPVHVRWNPPAGSVSGKDTDMVLAAIVGGVPGSPGSLYTTRQCPVDSPRNLVSAIDTISGGSMTPNEVRVAVATLVREGKIEESRYKDTHTKNLAWGWKST